MRPWVQAAVTMALSLQMLLTRILSCRLPLDVSGPQGVKVEALPGSRVHYPLLPEGMRLSKGSTLEMDFRPEKRGHTGLLFGARNPQTDDVATVFLHQGYLVFARQCLHGSVFEIYRTRLHERRWHELKYVHNDYGGTITIDGVKPFRQYHMGPCANFESLYVGGSHTAQLGHPSWTGTRQSFQGCIRNLKLNDKRPESPPRYHVVSVCDLDEPT